MARTGARPLGWAIAICVIITLVVSFPPWMWLDWGLRDTYCDAQEDISVCVREWGPTIVGLLAFIASTLAVIYLVVQVREMQGQRRMLEQQLAHDRGDIAPELTLLDNVEGLQSGRFKITNYNRRALKVCEIRWQVPQQFIGTDHINGENGNVLSEVDADGRIQRWQNIPAWTNRGADPPTFIGEFSMGKRDGSEPDEREKKLRATLEIVCFYVGTREIVKIHSWAPVGEVYF